MTRLLQPRKRFGQHFLNDERVLSSMVDAIAPSNQDNLLEIGPGRGALTDQILRQGCTLLAIEIDRDLIAFLKNKYMSMSLSLIQADALEFDYQQLGEPNRPLRIFGNLPYNISTPLLFHLFEDLRVVKDMHFLLQKEVVDRLVASPGTKAYGRLGIMAQYYCTVESLFEVGPESFTPPPRVNSAFVRLIPHKTKPSPCKNIKSLQEIVRVAFTKRRKMLQNSFKDYLSTEEMKAIGIDCHKRPEELTLEEYVRLADTWNAKNRL